MLIIIDLMGDEGVTIVGSTETSHDPSEEELLAWEDEELRRMPQPELQVTL